MRFDLQLYLFVAYLKFINDIVDSVRCFFSDGQFDPETECRKSTIKGYEETGFCYIGFSTWWTYNIESESCVLYTFKCGELPSGNIYESQEACMQFCSGILNFF